MKTTLSVSRIERGAVAELVARVAITNDSGLQQTLPLARLAEDPENLALDIRDSKNNRIEPVDFVMVAPKKLIEETQLDVGNTFEFERKGRLEPHNEYLYLVFPRATFRLLSGKRYSVALRWYDFVSDRSDLPLG